MGYKMAVQISEQLKQEIIRQHLIDGTPVRTLAKQYKIAHTTIHAWTKTVQIEHLKTVANQIVEVKHNFSELNSFEQKLTCTIAEKLGNISDLTLDVAELESKSAKKLANIKAAQILNLDAESIDRDKLANVKILGDLVNDSMKTPLNLLNANQKSREKEKGGSMIDMSEQDYIKAIDEADKRLKNDKD